MIFINKATIFTDGSSRGNPGRGGWGSVLVEDDRVTELGGREDNTTNNRMELTAVIEAISILKFSDKPITINTDSSYVINGITKWINGWKRNAWKTKTKDDVLNRDLWEKLFDIKDSKDIKWNYVGGHSGIVGNERCDVIATSFADNRPIDLYKGNLENYHLKNILELSKVNKKVISRSFKKSHSKVSAYSYVSMIDGEIQIYKTWVECEAKVKGRSGIKYKKAVSLEDEKKIIKEFKIL